MEEERIFGQAATRGTRRASLEATPATDGRGTTAGDAITFLGGKDALEEYIAHATTKENNQHQAEPARR